MPIKINLLTEALAEEDLRRRDPVKQAFYLGGFLVVLTLVWFSSTWLKFKMSQSSLDRVESQIQLRTNANAQVLSDMKAIGETKRRIEALATLHNARLLKGNLLNALQKIYVPNVQLMRLKLDQSYDVTKGKPSKKVAGTTVPGRPATSTQKTLLTLDAKDSSPNPGDQVNHYKEAIIASSYFKSNLQTNGVRLTNLSPAQSNSDGKAFVLFTLECRFPDITR